MFTATPEIAFQIADQRTRFCFTLAAKSDLRLMHIHPEAILIVGAPHIDLSNIERFVVLKSTTDIIDTIEFRLYKQEEIERRFPIDRIIR